MLTATPGRHRTIPPSTGTGSAPNPAPEFLPPRDEAMKHLDAAALQVAACDETVLLLGETGVGKDMMARRIHNASARSGKRFVQINCAALPDGLLESELFGHVRGAYTGAVDSQPGQFEVASGGTIFLDEIAEMSPRLQAKLLHVLQERVFCRVGGREPIAADVRVIAATNQDLDRAMAEGSFRRDLYYRLSVVCLRIPALRERPGDIADLARFFALKYSSLYNRDAMAIPGDAVIDAMMRYPFEGNIRELENLVKRAILLGSYDQILQEIDRPRAVPEAAAATTAEAPVEEPPFFAPERPDAIPLKEIARRAVESAERRAILSALSSTGWNRRQAARQLKVSYRALLYKIRDYAIIPLDPGAVAGEDRMLASHPIVSPRGGTC